MMGWQEQHDAVAAAIAKFPTTFGLRAFPGKTFRISQGYSYVNDSHVVMLYTEIETETGWQSFCKGTESELRSQIVAL